MSVHGREKCARAKWRGMEKCSRDRVKGCGRECGVTKEAHTHTDTERERVGGEEGYMQYTFVGDRISS